MRGLLAVLLACTLAACGDIDYHERSAEQLEAKAGYPDVRGWTEWTPFSCDVYLLPPNEYPSPACYEAVIKHEERHCTDHNYHPNTPAGWYIPVCDD